VTTFAILPVKRFEVAKQRLADDLGKGTRRALVEAMITDVLIALRRSKGVDRTLVVTAEPGVDALAHGYDADSVSDPGEPSHSAAALLGIREATIRGATRVLLVPGDCPALDPAEIDALLARERPSAAPDVVVVPDRHGSGTNALLLTPPDAIEPAFGTGSRERHVARSQAAGATVEVIEVPSLAYDVDTVSDLDALRDVLAGGRGGAAHTRGMLNRLARR
jgi:2-phospho-L-lactate/phosphoenolpyruvate guanylyltransferase